MFQTRDDIINKIHLLISIIIVVPVSVLYGFFPDAQFELFPETKDEYNFFKSIMGLYLGFALLWSFGLFKSPFLKTAIITNMIFMLAMGSGRLLSLLMDGVPTFGYTFGTFAELFLGCYGLWVLKRMKT